VTKVASRWFPLDERATASGFGSLAMYLGIVVGMALTPYLALQSGIESTLLIYGIVSLIAAVLFMAFSRERPPTPPCPPEQEERSLATQGLRQVFRSRDFRLLLMMFFVGLGVFNAVSTWIEDVLRPRGFSMTQAGITGGLMVLAGVIGAVIIPLLSDHYRKRVPFLVLALAGAIVGLVGITYATSYWLLLASAFVLGFFLLSAGPVGFQYGAEITYPAPEGTSNGLLLMMGQISGIAFIFGMDMLKSPATGSMATSLVVLIGLMAVSLLACTRLRESTLIQEGGGR